MSVSLSFLGAAGTVTGSKYLLQTEGGQMLVDCGLFQGLKQLRLKNWSPLPVELDRLDGVVLTHAHLDHSGFLPAIVKSGYGGPIYCSPATLDICKILLPDSGHIQEMDAEFANRHGFSKHTPALPLYTSKDAQTCLEQFEPFPFGTIKKLPNGAELFLRRAGHILGASTVEVRWNGAKIVFSGDLGRSNDPMMHKPEVVEEADYLVVESTYGNRRHEAEDPATILAQVINETVARGGTIVIPAFAVGRAQSLLYYMEKLKSAGKIGDVPVFLDSPMAINASELLCRYPDDHKLGADECKRACGIAKYVRTVEESKALTLSRMPKVIISASGMATGGRVLHHLKQYAPNRANSILFCGFQAAGTRGASIVAGAESVKIHGEYVPIRAHVQNLGMLSAHADADEIVAWLKGFRKPPKMTYITHGEPVASDALRKRIEEELGWHCTVPEHGTKVELA